jgi:hypothetical protein
MSVPDNDQFWVDWRALEEAVGLEDLPRFHRAFLQARGQETEAVATMALRRVQQAVERELNTLKRSDLAQTLAQAQGKRLLVARSCLPDLTLSDGRELAAVAAAL